MTFESEKAMPIPIRQSTGVEVYCDMQDVLGEGPLWSGSEQALFWLDIARKRVHRKSPTDLYPLSWILPDYPGCLAELQQEGLAVAMGAGVHRLDLKTNGLNLLSTVTSRRPGTRFNDGKVDPKGRFWAGSMLNNYGPNGTALPIDRSVGTLYCFDVDGNANLIEDEIGIPNTFAWSPDLKQFYFADSLQGPIYVYDFHADSGHVRNKRIFFEGTDQSVPDGSAMDVDGCLWNARWDGGAVLRITPYGKLDRIIALPVPRPTSCAFGGPDLDTLFVTSARDGLTPSQLAQYPLSGCVFAIHGVGQGVLVPPYQIKSDASKLRNRIRS